MRIKYDVKQITAATKLEVAGAAEEHALRQSVHSVMSVYVSPQQ